MLQPLDSQRTNTQQSDGASPLLPKRYSMVKTTNSNEESKVSPPQDGTEMKRVDSIDIGYFGGRGVMRMHSGNSDENIQLRNG